MKAGNISLMSQEHANKLSFIQVRWTIPQVSQTWVKNTSLYIQGQCLFVWNKLFTALFLFIKISS